MRGEAKEAAETMGAQGWAFRCFPASRAVLQGFLSGARLKCLETARRKMPHHFRAMRHGFRCRARRPWQSLHAALEAGSSLRVHGVVPRIVAAKLTRHFVCAGTLPQTHHDCV